MRPLSRCCWSVVAHRNRGNPHRTAPMGPASPRALAGATYRIDSARSELRILVYRAGAMAMLGHNHVIANRALSGWVRYSGKVTEASFALTVPDAGFVVDDDGDAPRRRRGFRRRDFGGGEIRDHAQHAECRGARRRAISGDHDQERDGHGRSRRVHRRGVGERGRARVDARGAVHFGDVFGPPDRKRSAVGAPIRSRA